MSRPKFYRDPVHLQIRYDAVDLKSAFPREASTGAKTSWLVRSLVDCPEFQRLRHIRQNGLTNFVFHGAEHSRFAHSMGAAYLAREMYSRIERNSDAVHESDFEALTSVAALLHDVGHGPFSHTLEEILKADGVDFDHEVMTQRMIEEETSSLHNVLRAADARFPTEVVYYIDKKKRLKAGQKEHWRYRLVSSQLDADRLDYLKRDAHFAGIQGGFDIARLLDTLQHLDGTRIAVERRSLVTVEAYLVMLDQMYRAVYYHHTTRAASTLLSSVMRRAFRLYRDGDKKVFPSSAGHKNNPLKSLVDHGQAIPLEEYSRLSEYHAWALIEAWQFHGDKVLADLATRLVRRRLFKTIDIVFPEKTSLLRSVEEHGRELAIKALPHLKQGKNDAAGLYVSVDEPDRTSYKRYDWRSEAPDESIWLVQGGRKPATIEEDQASKIVQGLKGTTYFHRLVIPEEIKADLLRDRRDDIKKLQGDK